MISSLVGIFSPRRGRPSPPRGPGDEDGDSGPETQAVRDAADAGPGRRPGSDEESDDGGSLEVLGPETQGPAVGGSTPPGPSDARDRSSQGRSTRQVETDGALGSGRANNDNDGGDVPAAGARAEEEEEEEGEDAALSSFFAHVSRPSLSRGPSSRRGRGEDRSYKQWRRDRKEALFAYLERRLDLGGGDEDGEGDVEEEEKHGVSPAGDCAWSQPGDVRGGEFGEAASPATRAARKSDGDGDDGGMADGGDEEGSEMDDHLETQALETQPLETQAMESQALETQPLETQALETQPLETQPLETQPVGTPHDTSTDGKAGGDDGSSDDDGGGGGGFLGGLSRRLGFSGSKPGKKRHRESETDGGPSAGESKRRRLGPSESTSPRASAAGRMWDGNPASVPCVTAARRECTSVSDVDLSAGTVDLSTCRVLRVWGRRDTKRARRGRVGPAAAPEGTSPEGAADGASVEMAENGDAGSPGDSEGGTAADYASAMVPFGRFEDDGPLDTVYGRVFSLEIVQLDQDGSQSAASSSRDDGDGDGDGGGSARRRADELFPDGAAQIRLTSDRRRRHGRRRMKLFLYGKVANAAEGAIASLTSGRGGAKRPPGLLVSLRGVPPECVFPHRVGATEGDFHREEEARLNPFGDPDLGSPSSYCVCVGDASGVSEDGVPVHFAGEATRLHFASAPAARPRPGDGVAAEETVVDPETVTAGPPYFRGEKDPAASLAANYCRLTWGDAPGGPAATGRAADRSEGRDGGAGGRRGDGRAAADGGHSDGPAGGPDGHSEGDASAGGPTEPPRNDGGARASIIPRPPRLATLSSLRSILDRGQTRADLYGIVLGFSSPSRTNSGQHKMSIVLVDETLPLPSTDGGGDVESVTLVFFSRHPSGLPKVRSAGDVVYLERIRVQEFAGNVQLAAYSNSRPVVAVARPSSAAPGGWTMSAAGGAAPPPGFDGETATRLRGWGLRRLSSHPTVPGRKAATLSCLNENATGGESTLASGGDLTVVVAGIVETPEGARRRDSPRGYLRVWDGTGPSRSDPHPFTPDASASDPPMEVLTSLESSVGSIRSSPSDPGPLSGADVGPPVALCGRVVNAVVWEEGLWDTVTSSSVRPGSFVRLRNVLNAASGPTVSLGSTNCISVHSKSSLTPLPNDAYEIKLLLRRHHDLVKSGARPNPTSAILPSRTRDIARQMRDNGFTVLAECTELPPPRTFTVQFEVSHTVPRIDSGGGGRGALAAFVRRRPDGAARLQLALHVSDSTGEADVLCLGRAAEELLGGATAGDIVACSSDGGSSAEGRGRRCDAALEAVSRLTAPGTFCEAKVRSTVGKDGRLYFILKSLFYVPSDPD